MSSWVIILISRRENTKRSRRGMVCRLVRAISRRLRGVTDQTQKVQFEDKTIYVTRTQKKWDMGDPSEDLTIISIRSPNVIFD